MTFLSLVPEVVYVTTSGAVSDEISVDQTIELPVSWYYTKLIWRHGNDLL